MISAPSGVGKTTLVKSLPGRVSNIAFSVSCTTRSPRPGEVDGVDYHFVTREVFLAGIASGRFLEWAHVHDRHYGTDRQQVEGHLRAGRDVILDIDVQGARQVRSSYPLVLTVFIIPPSMEVLRSRLEQRGTESSEQVAARLAAAERELREAPWYDFVVVNDDLEEAVEDLAAIIRSARCHRLRQAQRLHRLLASMNLRNAGDAEEEHGLKPTIEA